VAVGDREHAGQDPDPAGGRRDRGEQRPRLVRRRRPVEVVRRRDVVEAERLRHLRLGNRVDAGAGRAGQPEADEQLGHDRLQPMRWSETTGIVRPDFSG
jgi:hypothetical protein